MYEARRAFGFLSCFWLSPFSGNRRGKTGVVNLQKAVVESVDGRGAVIRLRHEFVEPQETRLERLAAGLKTDKAKIEENSKRRSRWFPWRHAVTAKQKVRQSTASRAE